MCSYEFSGESRCFLYYLLLLEGGPRANDCFIITLLGVHQMLEDNWAGKLCTWIIVTKLIGAASKETNKK